MLTIYGALKSRASRTVWLAKELELPYRHVPVIQAYRLADPNAADAPLNTGSPAFLAVNPSGQIPSIDDDGLVLHESLAINLYLAAKHGGPLAPVDIAEAGQMAMWSFWAATAAEPNALLVLQHLLYKPEAERDPTIAAAAAAALVKPLAVLDAALAGTGWLVGGRFTVADLNVVEVVRYAMPATHLFDAAPRVKAWLAACQARPGFQAMTEERAREG